MLAFILPDHGAERPGMGDAWAEHPSWELVGAASEASGIDVQSLLLGRRASLSDLAEAHLATFVLSLVALDAAERLGLAPMAVAGYGLGEYTALATSGAIDFEEGVRLVLTRARLATEVLAGPHVTVAVSGISDADAEAACARAEADAYVAGYDAPGEVRITGRPEGVASAVAVAATLSDVRWVEQPPSGGFHTPLLAQAREPLRKALAATSFSELDPVVVANVDARHHEDAADWPGLLSAQLSAPVRWRQSAEALYDDGVRTFVEFGAGDVLAERIRRTFRARSVEAHAIETPADLEALVQHLVERGVRRRPNSHAQLVGHLVVSTSAGPFEPAPEIAHAMPKLAVAADADAPREAEVHVGDLLGWVGGVEVRSAFDGVLGGLLVIKGERVLPSQPVAWLRTSLS